ncbi:MAG: DNA mismatch repair endonuclease MutL [Desulfobacteraceae bacterium]|nr:DNA mismatch repair endonuclease MutL [Desulfobacteraceae bacterium]
MSKIRILPENLSNQIAAGEVVERPASVVKELVENSIDAGSGRIVVEIEQGGKKSIRVFDDGEGMTRDDALLSIERYATSKISEAKDLFSINTLGFRGEALPSIASVSHFSVLTKSRLENSGTKIEVKGGTLLDVKETGAPDGTDIRISHLFFNTPARRKFMKAETTEMGHISEVISCLALSSPEIYFRLSHNKRILKEWPGGKFSDRALEVLGSDFKNLLYEVSNEYMDVKVTGFAGSPDITRSTPSKIYIFVNNRYVMDRSISYAVYQGYEGRLMKGRYPGCVLFINLPYDKVDVNVHPAKHQVRFAEPGIVMSCVKRAIANALLAEDRVKWKSKPLALKVEPHKKESLVFPGAVREKSSGSQASFPSFGETKSLTIKDSNLNFSRENIFPEKINKSSWESLPKIEEKDETSFKYESVDQDEKKGLNQNDFLYSDLFIVSQIKNTYIICESMDGMILIDQHAAHERIRYESLLRSYEKNMGRAQQLILPQVIEPGVKESSKLLLMLEEFKKFGLEISHYGGNSFAVQSVPLILGDIDFKPLILDVASMFKELPSTYEIKKVIYDAIALIACHGSIRGNQKLDSREIKALFQALDKCENSSRCPHGRPIWIKLDWDFIEKSFKRKL